MDRDEVAYAGHKLCDVSQHIDETDFVEEASDIDLKLGEQRRYGGYNLTGLELSERKFKVYFTVSVQDRLQRRSIISAINKWAVNPNGEANVFLSSTWLTVNNRPNQMIQARCTKFADMSSMNYADTLSLEFTALDPFWKDQIETSFTYNSLPSPGATSTTPLPDIVSDAPVRASFLIRNVSGGANLTSLSLGIAGIGQTMNFSGLSLPNGKEMVIVYNETTGLMEIRLNYSPLTSLMNKRTGADDCLLGVYPYTNYLVHYNDVPVTVIVSWRGLHL